MNLAKLDIKSDWLLIRFTFMTKSPGFSLRSIREQILHEHVLISSGNWWYGIFSLKSLILLENIKHWHSFVFSASRKHIKVNSPLEYKSVWPSGKVSRP